MIRSCEENDSTIGGINNYMSEEQNILEEEPIDNKQPTDENSPPVPDAGLLTTNQKLETEEMEVNKHPHHVSHKKKWGEYFIVPSV